MPALTEERVAWLRSLRAGDLVRVRQLNGKVRLSTIRKRTGAEDFVTSEGVLFDAHDGECALREEYLVPKEVEDTP